MEYLHDNVFLTTATAQRLYHDVAKNLPIIDFHTHLPQDEILSRSSLRESLGTLAEARPLQMASHARLRDR